jgi:hypothetical protein
MSDTIHLYITLPVRYGVRPDIDRLFHDIFVTALEGGISYWASVRSYHWSTWSKDGTHDDLENFSADIAEYEDETKHTINRHTILAGIQHILTSTAKDDKLRERLVANLLDPERADFDADDADVIVQAGLFSEIVYS